jgi:methyl-accepting chemotaxis protein
MNMEQKLQDDSKSEVLINAFRIAVAFLFIVGQITLLILNLLKGKDPLPFRAFLGPGIFFLYGVFVLFLLRKSSPPPGLKYFSAVFDPLVITFCILMTGTYASLASPGVYPGVYPLYYFIFIVLGALRKDIPSVIVSAIIGALGYFISILVLKEYIPSVSSEIFRVIAILLTGIIVAMAMKSYSNLLKNFSESQKEYSDELSSTFKQTLSLVKTIQGSTGNISVSYRNNFATANNQAASVTEIESTINENAQIAAEIADKTGSVATIASKMEDDINTGFSVLERNVNKMSDIKEKNNGVISGIISLGNKIAKIRDIVRVINTITDQTKVIAFNAALEAASAGETGKRFAVVAGEVNRLADDIASLTRQIREQVEEIQSSSSSLIISSEESSDRIAEGYKLIKDLEDIFKEIRSGAEITSNQAQTITVSTQKQRKSTEQINIAIADISQGLKSFIHSTEVATSSAEKLTDLARELENALNRDNKPNGN